MKKIILVIVMLTSIKLVGQHFQYVNTQGLNVRGGAGANFEIVEELHKGDKIEVVANEGNWTKIKTTDGNIGFVSSKYLSNEFTNTSNSGDDEDNSFARYFIIGLIVLSAFKLLFGGDKSSSKKSKSQNKSNSRTNTKQSSPKIYCYHCKNCNLKIESTKQPNALNCPNSNFHRWTKVGEVGQEIYNCKHCGTTVNTKRQPNSLNCPNSNFHHWTKLT